jgi:hypothetical protein
MIFDCYFRGCSIQAVELITQRVTELLKTEKISSPVKSSSMVNSILVDVFLWEYRREHSKLMEAYPYHRVRSMYY